MVLVTWVRPKTLPELRLVGLVRPEDERPVGAQHDRQDAEEGEKYR